MTPRLQAESFYLLRVRGLEGEEDGVGGETEGEWLAFPQEYGKYLSCSH